MTEFAEKIYEVLTSMGNAECEVAAVIEALRERADECGLRCDPDWEECFEEMVEALEDAVRERRKRKGIAPGPFQPPVDD